MGYTEHAQVLPSNSKRPLNSAYTETAAQCPALRCRRITPLLPGISQLVEKEDLDTSDHATMWLRVRNMLIRRTLHALDVTGGTVERLTAKARKEGFLVAMALEQVLKMGGVYTEGNGDKGAHGRGELPKPRNEGKKPSGGAA